MRALEPVIWITMAATHRATSSGLRQSPSQGSGWNPVARAGGVREQAPTKRCVPTGAHGTYQPPDPSNRPYLRALLVVAERTTGEEPHRHRAQGSAMAPDEPTGGAAPATVVEGAADDDHVIPLDRAHRVGGAHLRRHAIAP
jgi:hypothetical protein